MGSKENILLGRALYFCLALSLGCNTTEKSESASANPTAPSSISLSGQSVASSAVDPEASDDEGRAAIEASLKGNSPLTSSTPASGAVTPSSSQPQPEGDLQKFPKSEDPEELSNLLLDNDQWNQVSLKNCLDELAEVTKTAKNSDSLKAASVTISTMIKDKIPQYHWCFLAGHHALNQEMSGNLKTIDQKISHFQAKMTIFVALSKSLDIATGSNRYARYTRDRYISHSRDYFGRKITPIDDPSK
ncbi:MAG: hypothetical protein WCI18_12155 [Pseudomonadota bacterium]